MYRKSFFVSTTILLILLGNSCKKEKAVDPSTIKITCTDSLTYENSIQPLLKTNCAVGQCHKSGNPYGLFNAMDYDTVASLALSSPSRLLNAIKHTGVIPMPRIDSTNALTTTARLLPDSIIQKIECWIEQGAPKN